jgi:hypothetical protein
MDNPDGSPQPLPVDPGGSLLPKGPAAGSLGAMIGQFKSRATKRIQALPKYANTPIWQRNYYEHIIRNEIELKNIWNYIVTNPLNWDEDLINPATPPNRFNQDKQHG